jgi:uncharacterized protein YktA (UPF0223 family)
LKIHCIASLFALLAISSLALAECPSSSSLAQVEGILDYYAQIDPALAPQANAFKRLVVNGVPEKELERVLESSNFRSSYDSIRDALAKIPQSQGISVCRSTLGTTPAGKGK